MINIHDGPNSQEPPLWHRRLDGGRQRGSVLSREVHHDVHLGRPVDDIDFYTGLFDIDVDLVGPGFDIFWRNGRSSDL